jgi:ferredoxin-NADP reductase
MIPDLNQEMKPDSIFKKLIIEEIREETRNFKTFVFKDGHHLNYQAGQFLTLIDHSGPREIRRSFSIISSPALHERLAISVKRIENGYFSRKLVDRARVGDTLLTTEPAGFFRLPDNIKSYKSIFFFAAGSGITPILSLIKTVTHLYPGIGVYLVYSNRSVGSTAFYGELKALEKKFPDQLRIDFLFSSESDLRKARLNRELLLELLVVSRFDRKTTLFYTCGPENYMRMIIFILQEEGFPGGNIRKEDFNPGNKKLTPRLPPDKADHRVQLQWKGLSYDFRVKYPDTILQAARKQHLELPYSCETGKCGSCAALCISGKLWLSNNEVLTEKDLSNGLVLTCTGYPQYGDVSLKID